MSSINVSIPSELIKIIDVKVASGLYNDASEVVCDALRQLDINTQLIYQMKLDRLKSALA
ncbi:MAG: type II toxin-antitoxin system ParD family antitoxin [Rickettsiales bacterium]|jgi:antitoxin ParD1/3/4